MNKKAFLSILLMLCSSMAFAQFSGSGTGTSSDPYLIFNENQLSQLNNFLNQEGVYFKLMKDLDLTNWIAENNPSQGWVPVGVASTPFKGDFNGNNHTISGLYINRPSIQGVGFFGEVNGANIYNLSLTGSTITGLDFVGGVVGNGTGSTISGCDVTMNEIRTQNTDVGGIVGRAASSSISECSYTGNIYATSTKAGGIVGLSNTGEVTISNCTATGGIYTQNSRAGGMVGSVLATLTLSNCHAFVALSGGQNGGEIGGIVGKLADGASCTLSSCHHEGEIVNSGDYTGGVVGVSYGACIASMTDCSHFGNIMGNNYVGGIVGQIGLVGESEAEPVYYLSTSSSTNTKSAGPYPPTSLIGGEEATVNNCVSIGNITGANYVGGLIGKDGGGTTYTFSSAGQSDSSGEYGKSGTNYRLWRNGTCVYSGGYYYFTPVDKINNGSIALTNSYYSGNIQGVENVGGLVGYKEGGSITKCYSYATMVKGTIHVGGIAGKIQGKGRGDGQYQVTLKSNVAINSTINATTSNLGRIYGSMGNDYSTIGALASAEGNRALTQTKVILSGVVQEVTDDLQNGTSMGPSALRLKANYVGLGWDFDNDWTILETECYPYKRYQAAPPVIESNLVSQATTISGKSLNDGTVYLFYKDYEPVSYEAINHQWIFATEPLQSGAGVQLCTHVEGMTPSYFTITSVAYPGSGTQADPYRVYTAEDLQGVSGRGYYKMMNDIDLTAWIAENSPTEGWISIGRNSGEATYFDGDGHTVSGLWINTNDDYTGLFSNFSTGEISNLIVQIADGKKVKGGNYTGGLIGRNANGKIENVTVRGNVEGTQNVGGVAGIIETNNVTNVSYEGTVTTSANDAHIGGIVGQTPDGKDCTFENCHATATINATGSASYVGGLAGMIASGAISNSHAQATVTSSGANSFVGGLAGWSAYQTDGCYSTGTVTATGDDSNTGGLIGWSSGNVSNSYSTVNVTGTLYTGGLIGYSTSPIDKCYAKGDVYGVYFGAGVVAEMEGATASLTNSVAANNILSLSAQSSWGSRVIGGYKNGCADPDESNFALSTMQVSLNNVPQTKTDDLVEGIAKTQAQLQTATTYMSMGWDFTQKWGIDEGTIYPYLLWEVTVSKVESITLDPATLLVACGNTATIAATVSPLSATNRIVEWSSSNESIATVDNGVVTAVAIGSAIITASATDGSGVTATCEVTVCKNEDDAIAVLRALVDNAQSLYDNSVEGANVGEYEVGAREQLLTVINAVNAQISDTMSAEAITSCTATINAAVETFQSKMVTNAADTNINAYDNILYAPSLEVRPGQQATLSICLKNTAAIASVQFDLVLPNGVTIPYSEEDEDYMINLGTERSTLKRHSLTCDVQEDGSMRVVCTSLKNYTFSGNDGEIINVTIDIDPNMADGEYPILLNNMEMATADMMQYNVAQCKSTLTVLSFTLGDVNGDHSVSVVDVNGVVNFILGTNTEGLIRQAADVNGDDIVSVVDANGVVNIIIYGNPYGASSAPSMQRGKSTVTPQIEDISISNEESVRRALFIDGVANEFSSLQFDIRLPEGVSIDAESDNRHIVTKTSLPNGMTRVVCVSLSNKPFISNVPLTMTFTADGSSISGDYTVTMTGFELARPNMTVQHPADCTAAMRIHGTTGIDITEKENEEKPVYTLQGIRVDGSVKNLEKGVYLQKGKKLIIK